MPGLGAWGAQRRDKSKFARFAKKLAYPSFVWFGVEGCWKIVGLGVLSSGLGVFVI
jgi:hypothetical protein